jgi:hypothetical protein
MGRDDEWAAWARDFQDSSDTAPAPEEMLSAARRATRRQRLGYVIELLASVGLVAFYVVMMQRQRATWFVAMASANFVFVALWMGYLTHVRRGTWSAAGSDVRTFASLFHSALPPPSASHTSRQSHVFPSPAVPVRITDRGVSARKFATISSRVPPVSKRGACTPFRFAEFITLSSYIASLATTGPYCRRKVTQLLR